jgi:tetratricopeptide (TPR) repeat protein
LLEGNHIAALEAAGEAVYLDPSKARGYILIGDVHLHEGNLTDAQEAYEKGLLKASRPTRDPTLDEDANFLALEAQAGLSRCALMQGDWDSALVSLQAQLKLDKADPLGATQLLAELHLFRGEFDLARECIADRTESLPDGYLVHGFAHYQCDDLGPATDCLRLALMQNLYLVAALLGEDIPDFGIVHGLEEAGPIFAGDVAIRLEPYLQEHEDAVEFLADLATCPTVMGEITALMDAAKALNATASNEVRENLIASISELRNPERVRATTKVVISELGGPSQASFDSEANDIPC